MGLGCAAGFTIVVVHEDGPALLQQVLEVDEELPALLAKQDPALLLLRLRQ